MPFIGWVSTDPLRLSMVEPILVRLAQESDTPRVDLDLLKLALQAHGEAYKDLTQSWRGVETKAQGTAAVAGVFLAGAFAFARELPQNVRPEASRLLIGTVLLLILSAIIALWSQRIQQMPYPPSSVSVHQWIEDIRRSDPADERSARLVGFYEDYNDAWLTTNTRLITIINRKARFVLVSQVALLIAGVLVAVLTVLVVFAKAAHP